MSARQELAPKTNAEQRLVQFDFTSLVGGDLITSATMVSEVWSGNDPTPSTLLVGSPSAGTSSTLVSQMVGGGSTGTIYLLTCKAATVSSQTLTLCGLLAITGDLS